MKQKIILSEQLCTDLAMAIAECEHDRIFILADETTAQTCRPLLAGCYSLKDAQLIVIPPSDTNKTLEQVSHVWQRLSEKGATRHSCLVNLGGGMITDLGGFAASTFKRGIDFINIPTTLLAMVDASVGGKTGFNFNGLKNEIGVFSDARFVILDTVFLRTLDSVNIRAGYAEMLKHGLISYEKMWADLINFELAALGCDRQKCADEKVAEYGDKELSNKGEELLQRLKLMVGASVKVKENVVETDPFEHNLRKALNLGHTFGHAFEAMSLRSSNPLPHGYAVAYGLVCELYLSAIKCGFPQDKLRQTVRFIRDHYGNYVVTCDEYPEIIRLMHHDKKNTAGVINFTLLSDIGGIQINQSATNEEINEALDFFREG